MENDDDLLAIAGCSICILPRSVVAIHIEQQWAENLRTVEVTYSTNVLRNH
jgi:hypothetical protein